MKRTWRYRYGAWLPPWWAYVVPQIGYGDEYGRKTAVIHIPFWGFLVWAYKTCYCVDCAESREQGWDKEWNDAVT